MEEHDVGICVVDHLEIHEKKNLTRILLLSVASSASSMSKAKSQTFDPFADLGNLGTNLPGKRPDQMSSGW